MRIVTGIVGFLGFTLGQAVADPVTNDVAKDALFKLKGRSVELVPHDFLSEKDTKVIEQVAQDQLYYAAIAVSPDDGLLNKATVAAANYHSTEDAEGHALKSCNAARDGAKRCVIVAYVRPEGWSAQDIQLSHAATDAWRKSYRRVREEKAFAASASTGKFSAAKGTGAAEVAIAACNDAAEATDCKLVIEN